MPTLPSLAESQVVIMTTCDTASDDKVGTSITLFYCVVYTILKPRNNKTFLYQYTYIFFILLQEHKHHILSSILVLCYWCKLQFRFDNYEAINYWSWNYIWWKISKPSYNCTKEYRARGDGGGYGGVMGWQNIHIITELQHYRLTLHKLIIAELTDWGQMFYPKRYVFDKLHDDDDATEGLLLFCFMMVSCYEKMFNLSGPLWGESTRGGFSSLKASNAKLWVSLFGLNKLVIKQGPAWDTM